MTALIGGYLLEREPGNRGRAVLYDLRSSWADFYNPSVYRDAGVPDAYAARQEALDAEVCREHRKRVSKKLVDYFLETGLLVEEPAL